MGAPESTTEAFRCACLEFADPATRDRAIDRFRGLADTGHAAACYNLAVLLLAGRDVARDDAAAEHYLRRAASQRYPGSYRPLGMMALRGRLTATRTAGGDVRRYLAGQWFARGWLAGDAEAHTLMLRHVPCLFACMVLCPWR
ncbi:tetratricopeptide repeat protein [Jeongeupia chitinilytica]|uniref:Sel1 repeat family protein n=1 Tax=Jeongeupia chitinilytica TaxID=1041641 RepID=A0ABQ3GZW8_9NEIS|nr:sel1 repeat family protein [Jeongeupia chitinilytica]GHD62486.1 hypothetical protein GCM10007350_18530 [Jeongeupia chitinilytica]